MKENMHLNLVEYEEILRLTYVEVYKIDVSEGTYNAIFINDNMYVNFPYSGGIADDLSDVIKKLIHKDDLESFFNGIDFNEISTMISRGERPTFKYRRLLINGDYCWTSHTIYKSSEDRNSEAYLCVVKDINDKSKDNENYLKNHIKVLQKQLKYHVAYDTLTDIYNKNKFYDETAKLLLNNTNDRFVLLRFDIERFKVINEFFGKEQGDELLKYIAKRIKLVFSGRKKCTFSRLEADIFCMCFVYSEAGVLASIEYVEKIIREYEIDFEVKLSFGAYIIEDNNTPVDLICDRANLALKTVKGSYIRSFAYFDDTLRSNLLKEQEIINDMNNALINEQFEVYLQPKCNLNTGEPIGSEALVRWNHPEKGLIPPIEFIPIFERNGFIIKLDAYVWEKVCKLIRKWLDNGMKVLPISVNISRINLYNPKLCSILIDLVEKYDIPANLLGLEITESAYIENQQLLINVMKNLQDHGFVILMDDFGSGYSSLNILKDIPVDVLKIDLKFLTGEFTVGKGGIILSSIIKMAKLLDISVIAEGVETKEQADFLYSIGCTKGQGYYFQKPIPICDFENYLNSFKLFSDKN